MLYTARQNFTNNNFCHFKVFQVHRYIIKKVRQILIELEINYSNLNQLRSIQFPREKLSQVSQKLITKLKLTQIFHFQIKSST